MTDKQAQFVRILGVVMPDALVRLKAENERLEAQVKIRRIRRRAAKVANVAERSYVV